MREKKHHRKAVVGILIAVMLTVVIAIAMLNEISKHRILLPPEITTETLLQKEEISAELLLSQSEAGTYNYVCQYDLLPEGQVVLTDRNQWQSYADTLPHELHRNLKKLESGKVLLQVEHWDDGIMAFFWKGQKQPWTLVETDPEGKEVFRHEFDASGFEVPCETALRDENNLYIFSYQKENQKLYITTVNKKTGKEYAAGISYYELCGKHCPEMSMGNFLIDSSRVRIQDNKLFLAATLYSPYGGAVLAAWDMKQWKPLYFEKINGAQVMDVQWHEDSVSVLLNHKRHTPLEVLELSLPDMQVLSSTWLPLPASFAGDADQPQDYFLFKADLGEDRTAVLFPDAKASSREERSELLAVYDRSTGRMIYESRLKVDSRYEIYEVHLK